MMMTPRNRILTGILALAFYALLAGGSFGSRVVVVGIQQVVAHRQALLSLASQTMDASRESAATIDAAFVELQGYLGSSQLSTETIVRMENTNAEIKQRVGELHLRMTDTETTAKQLFDMLEARAKQNQTASLRSQMLNDIETRQRAFNERMRVARTAVQQIQASAQKYDDVVGYVQVQAGLLGIDQHIGQIDDIITEANGLNQQIQVAIADGLAIIESLPVGS